MFYIFNHCDEWHSRDSFRLIGVVDEDHYDEAYDQIKNECEYSDDEMEEYIDVESVELNELDI